MIFSVRNSLWLLPLLLAACAAPNPSGVTVTVMGTQSVGRANDLVARASDTPETIAQSQKLDIQQLLELNGLVPSQGLKAGQKLSMPLPKEIRVIDGDTLDSLSKAFGIKKSELAKENNISQNDDLMRGMLLRLPQQESVAMANPAPVAATITSEELPAGPVVASGPISTTQSAGGQTVHNSATGTIVEEDLAAPPSAKVASVAPPIAKPAVVASAPAAPTPSAPKPAAPLVAPTRFAWPVNGSTLSEYGPKSGGQRNEGINIGAPLGTPVRAAAPGEVVYVGDNVAGFGTLVLVRHGGGYATAYAHVQNPLVKRGDRVTEGQAIAQVGKTGNIATPQLHFEVRKGTQPVNPKPFLS